MQKRFDLAKAITYVVLTIGAIVSIFPFYWMLRTAVANASDIFSADLRLFPTTLKLANFVEAMTTHPFAQFFSNSITVTLINMVGVLATSSLCAFGFSRINWKGRDTIFGIMMASLMLPFAVVMIPQFIFWNKLGMINTFVPITAPAFFGGGVFNIFLLRQFFLTIPKEMDEAAWIDGASIFRVFTTIILPLSKQVMIVVGLFTFLFQWNDYLAPMIYITSEKKFTLMLGLTLFQGSYSARWELMMAAVTIVVIPSFILFIFAQKYFIEGIAMTGIKG